MKTNVKMISGQRGRAAAAPPRGRQILHFLSDQTAPRPAPPRSGQAAYSQIISRSSEVLGNQTFYLHLFSNPWLD